MTIFLTSLHVFVCFLLIIVILLQAGRGQGLSSASFGSGNVQTLFGTRAADFLTKATTAAAVCFLLTSIGLDYLEMRKSRSLLEVSQRTAPVDIDQIKRALEQVRAATETGAQTVAPAEAEEIGMQLGVVEEVALESRETVTSEVVEIWPSMETPLLVNPEDVPLVNPEDVPST